MPDPTAAPDSSRGRYVEYRRRIRTRSSKAEAADDKPKAGPDAGRGGKSTHRTRAFVPLLKAFWGLLGSHRKMLGLALVTASVSTLLGLIPLYGTKLVFDNVLDTKPLPPEAARFALPSDPRSLLAVVGV